MKKKIIVFISILVVILSILLINSCSKKEDIKVTLLENNKVIDNGSYADEYVIINIEAKKVYKKIILVDRNTKEEKEYTPELIDGKYVLKVKVEETTSFDLYTIDEKDKKSEVQQVEVKIDRYKPEFNIDENKEVYTLGSSSETKNITVKITDIKDDSEYKIYYKLNNKNYKEIDAKDNYDLNLKLNSGLYTLSVKMVDGSGKELIKTKLFEVNYTLEIIDEKYNRTSLMKVLKDEKISYYETLPENINKLFIGYSVDKKNIIDNNYIVDNFDKIYVLYEEETSKLISKPTCNNSTYNGNGLNLINGNNIGYSVSNNNQINPGTYTIGINLKDGYTWEDGTNDSLSLKCTISKASIEVTTDTKTRSYNETELTGSAIISKGNLFNNRFVYESNSSITEVGSIKNEGTIKIYNKNNVDVTNNYFIKYNYGTLTVEKINLKVETGSSEKKYDSLPLTNSVITLTEGSLLNNHSLVFNSNSTITLPGKVENDGEIKVLNSGLEDVSSNYYIRVIKGILFVKNDDLSIKTGSSKREYDGTDLTNNNYELISGILTPGHTIVYNNTSKIKDVGTIDNTGSIIIRDSESKDITDTYHIDMDYGTLSVVKRNITVTTGSESRQYNGEELENRKVTVTTGSLPTNFRIKFNPTYSFVHPRSEENSGTIIIYDNNDNIVTDNFNITTVYGTIEVTKADQTCSIINVSNTKYGTNPNGTYDYTCSGPTTNAVHYSSSDDSKITVGNKTYKINVGSGSADIEVYQEGSQDYNASSVAKHTINIATEKFNVTYTYNKDLYPNVGTVTITNSVISESYGSDAVLQSPNVTVSDWKLIGWTDDKTSKTKKDSITVTKDTTLYALFKLDGVVNISFNTGTTESVAALTGSVADNYSNLPIVENGTKGFNGWYYNDELITTNSVIPETKNIKLTAHYSTTGTPQVLQTSDTMYFVYGIDIDKNLYNIDGKDIINTWIIPNIDNINNENYWPYSYDQVTAININKSFINYQPTTMNFWFGFDKTVNNNQVFSTVKNISGLDNIDTSKVKNMVKTFAFTKDLEEIDISSWDTSSLESLQSTFWRAESIKSLDFSNFNTEKLKNLSYTFGGCYSLESLDLSNFDTSNVTTLSYTFGWCRSLTSLNLMGFDTRNVVSVVTMLESCYNLIELDISSFDLSKCLNFRGMFKYCTKLETIYCNVDFLSYGTSLEQNGDIEIFLGCTSLKNFNSNNIGIDYANPDTGYFTPNYIKHIYLDYTALDAKNDTFLNATSIEFTDSVLDSTYNFVANFDKNNDGTIKIYSKGTEVYIYSNTPMYFLPDSHGMFSNLNVERIEFNDLIKTNHCTNLTQLFYHCGKIKSLDLSCFDTSNAGFSFMFEGCTSLESADLSSFNTSNAKSLSYLFCDCRSLKNVNLSSFDTRNVNDISYMFFQCWELLSVDLSNFNTSNVTNTKYMFYDCHSLTSLNISNFDVSNVSNMRSMFTNCSKLVSLDLSSFDTRNVTNVFNLFSGDSSLTTIYVSNKWDISSITGNDTDGQDKAGGVFAGCIKLVGGNGTIYSSSHTNKDYAIVDGENPGYLTLKVNKILNFSKSITSETTSIFNDIENIIFENGTTYTNDYYDLSVNQDRSIKMYFINEDCIITSNGVIEFPSDSSKFFNELRNIKTIDFGEGVIDTSKVTTMTQMFYYCKALTSLDLSEFDTSNVSNMNNMFAYMISITDYDLSSFDTRKVTNMNKMFYDNASLVNLDISNFVTPVLEYMENMFAWNIALKNVNLDNIDTSNVINMRWLFSCCHKIEVIDLSNFDTSKVENMFGMFSGCKEVNTIYVGEKFTTDLVVYWAGEGYNYGDEIFSDCPKLVGRNGTKYNADHIGIDYARIDDSGAPGYFSVKTLKNLYTSYISNDSDLKSTLMNASSLTFTDSILDDSYTFRANVDSRNLGFIKLYSKNNDLYIYSNSEVYLPYSAYQVFRELNNATSINFNGLLKSNYTISLYWLFCRDFKLESIDLSGFDTSKVDDLGCMFEQCSSLVNVDLSNFDTSKVFNFSYLFSNCHSLVSVDLSGFDFSNATSFNRMFAGCEKLTTIYCNVDFKKIGNLTGVATENIFTDSRMLPGFVSSNTNIDFANPDTGYFTPNYMINFYSLDSTFRQGATSLTFTNSVLDDSYTFISNFDSLNHGTIKMYKKNNDIYITSKDTIYLPINSKSIFNNCVNMEHYYFDNISTIHVEDFSYMFSKNRKLASIDLSNFDTRSATNMEYMFDAVDILTNLDISNFDTSKVTNFRHMFAYASALTNLNLGSLNTSNAVNLECMFYHVHDLVSLDIISFDVSKVTNFSHMFDGCKGLTVIYCDGDWSSRSSSLVTDGDLDMFKDCLLLSNYSESNVNINYANASTGYFTGRTMKNIYNSYTSDTNSILYDTLVNATSIEFTNSVLDGSYTFKDNLDSNNKGSIKLYSKGTNLYIYSNDKVYFPENSKSLFRDLNELTKINFNNLIDTSHVTNMSSLFRDCPNLLSLDLRSFDTSNVTLMSDMFVSCLKLASINLSSFDTSNVTSMDYMFTYCSSLTNLDISSFKATNVSSTRHMFYNDQNLVSLDMSNFNTNSLKDANGMFAYCSKLTSLDISSFNTSNVLTMYEIFKGCTLLEKIYVSNKFIVSNLVDNYNHNGTIENGKADIFTDSLNLVGGSGTVYNSSYTDSSYAVVDMAYYDESGSIVSGTPGYLTLRNIIPNNYERVSYIETSKTQYITTDISINDIKNKYIMDVKFKALSVFNYNTLWGSTYDGDMFEGWIYLSGGIRSRNAGKYTDERNLTNNSVLNSIHRYTSFAEVGKYGYSLYDNNYNAASSEIFSGSIENLIGSDNMNSNKILLFKSGTDYSHLKVYSFRIISNDVIIGDFVPVKRKSDGIYGMYDTVRNKFYKSEGTSEFIGPSE